MEKPWCVVAMLILNNRFSKHLEQQRDALKTMRSMSQKDLDELANDFRHAVGRGSYIQQDVWANLAPKNGFTASPWDIAFNNYEHMINQTLARGELGNFNTEQFAVHEHFLNAYNRAVVDLAAGIISQAAAATVPAQSNIFTGDLFARSAEQASIMKEQ